MSKKNRVLIQELLDNLEKLVSGMDIPQYKKRSVSWLNKNLSIRNKTHKNYDQAMKVTEELLSRGVSHG